MDVKIQSHNRSRPKPYRRGKKSIPRNRMRSNQMLYRTGWEYGTLTSGTSGAIAASDIAPNIGLSSEYSTLQTLFTESKILSFRVIFSSIQLTPTAGTLHGHMWIGTNQIFNYTTNTTPTSVTNVQNLTKSKQLATYTVKPHRYTMALNRPLMFGGITTGGPTVPQPYYGSPGTVCVWADGLSASTAYFKVDIIAIFMLRGRQ